MTSTNSGFRWDPEPLHAIRAGAKVTIEYVELFDLVDLTEDASVGQVRLVDAVWVGVGRGVHSSAPVAIVFPTGTPTMLIIALCEIKSITEVRVLYPECLLQDGPASGPNDVRQPAGAQTGSAPQG